jgi:hypothetical protein
MLRFSHVEAKGEAVCTREPRGDHGLEGYVEGLPYRYQRCRERPNERHPHGLTYYRVYPQPEEWEEAGGKPYFEVCRPFVFKRHFKVITCHDEPKR